jgi:tetratricopeptide (TPR) repeat protein
MSNEQSERYKAQGNAALQAKMFSEAVDLYTKARRCLTCSTCRLSGRRRISDPRRPSQAIAGDPNSAVYFSNRSAAYAAMDKWREALDDAHEATMLQPSWVKGYVRKAGALSHLGKHEEARKAYLKATQLEPHNQEVAALLEQAGEAARKAAEEGKDWEQDLWSDDDEPADAKQPPASSSGGGGGGARAAPSDELAPSASCAAPLRASSKLSHELDRSLADASEETMRSALRALGQADAALAQKMVHLLEGLNAASSEGEGEDEESGDEAEPQHAQRKRRRDQYFGVAGGDGDSDGRGRKAGGAGGAAARQPPRRGRGGGSDSDD